MFVRKGQFPFYTVAMIAFLTLFSVHVSGNLTKPKNKMSLSSTLTESKDDEYGRSALTKINIKSSHHHNNQKNGGIPINRLGSVDLGIMAETTPIIWRDTLWLLECIQGKMYYGNLEGESYLRFTNPLTGERSPDFAIGYGLASAIVDVGFDEKTETMYVFATKTPSGISGNNTEISMFWSTDIMSSSLNNWNTKVVLVSTDTRVIPEVCDWKTLWNTSVQKGQVNGSTVFLMAYEYNCGEPGWQTHFAIFKENNLASPSSSKWEPVPFTNQDEFVKIAHANPTIRYNKIDQFWYLMSTRGGNGILVEDIYRTKTPTEFTSWEAPSGWLIDDLLAAPLLFPSKEDQVVAPLPWHPDTKAIVKGNATELSKGENINTSDMDLCTAIIDGKTYTIMYWAWGNQGLGPTAMVLSIGIAEGPMETFLSSYF